MERRQILLPGERFCPMEDELILDYLIPKVKNKPIPGGETLISYVNLYGKDKEPWQIWEENQGGREHSLRKNKDLYFFTRLTKASENGDRISRVVGNGGTWKGQTKGRDIYLCDGNGEKITNPKTRLGVKKNYSYTSNNGANSDQEKCWIMYEYELKASRFITKKEIEASKGMVLCLLRKNDKAMERRRNKKRGNSNNIELQDEVVVGAVDQQSNNVNGGDVVNAIVTQVDQRLQPIYNYQAQMQGYNNNYYNLSEPQQRSEGDLSFQYEMPLFNIPFEPPPLCTVDYPQQTSYLMMTSTEFNSANNVTSGEDYFPNNEVYDDQVNVTSCEDYFPNNEVYDDQVNKTAQSTMDQEGHCLEPPPSMPQLNMPPLNLIPTNFVTTCEQSRPRS